MKIYFLQKLGLLKNRLPEVLVYLRETTQITLPSTFVIP